MATYDLGRFRLRTGCDRDAQARALARIEELAEGDQQLRDGLSHGSHVGRSPQTIHLDYNGYEAVISIRGDGTITTGSGDHKEELDPWDMSPEEFRSEIDPDDFPRD